MNVTLREEKESCVLRRCTLELPMYRTEECEKLKMMWCIDKQTNTDVFELTKQFGRDCVEKINVSSIGLSALVTAIVTERKEMNSGAIGFDSPSPTTAQQPVAPQRVLELRLPASIQPQGNKIPIELLKQQQVLPALNNNEPLDLLSVVRVKVSGPASKTYHTQVGTLLQFPDTLLAEMVTPPFPFYDAVTEVHVLPDGVVDPDSFGIVLDFMRSGAWQPIMTKESYESVCSACSAIGLPAFPRNPSSIGTELLTGGMASSDHPPTGLHLGSMMMSSAGNDVGLDYYSPGGAIVIDQQSQVEQVTSSRGHAVGVRSTPRTGRTITSASSGTNRRDVSRSRSPRRARNGEGTSFVSNPCATERYEHIEVEIPVADSALNSSLREYSLRGFRIVAEKKGRTQTEAAGSQQLYGASNYDAPRGYDNTDDHFDELGNYVPEAPQQRHVGSGQFSTLVTMRRKISPLENMDNLISSGQPKPSGIDWNTGASGGPGRAEGTQLYEPPAGGPGSTTLSDQAAALKFIQNSS